MGRIFRSKRTPSKFAILSSAIAKHSSIENTMFTQSSSVSSQALAFGQPSALPLFHT